MMKTGIFLKYVSYSERSEMPNSGYYSLNVFNWSIYNWDLEPGPVYRNEAIQERIISDSYQDQQSYNRSSLEKHAELQLLIERSFKI